MFRYPIYIIKINLYMDKVSVYYLDPLYFRCNLLIQINALLRDHQKVAASKPIK